MGLYFNYYILSYFSKKITSTSQINHIFHGKRTPSMFYLVEVNKKHHGFSQFKNISKEKIEKNIKQLVFEEKLIRQKKGYALTDIGKEKLDTYFQSHYYPQEIKDFSNVNLRKLFWERYQLYTQVFSEYSNNNVEYSPVIKHPSHQENVRQLFYVFKNKKDELFYKWVEENKIIFTKMNLDSANLLANFLTGHQFIGHTRDQMLESFQMSPVELNFFIMDSIEDMIGKIREYKNKVPLLYKVLKVLDAESLYGLSPSTFLTYEMINRGNSIEQIARNRKIKENTVKEHILEISFIVQSFPYINYIPQEIYQELKMLFGNHVPTFREAKTQVRNTEFMHYRLVDLERLRAK